jgi:hypothetical protein
MDLAENSVSARAGNIVISVGEDYVADRLTIAIQDDGVGMDADMVARVIDPFTTSRTTRKVGLGIPLLKEAAELCNGDLTIHSTPGVGTLVAVDFEHSHIDRMPLGDLAGTWLSLLVAHPEIHWNFEYRVRKAENVDEEFIFDDRPVKETLEDIPLSDPLVLGYLREALYTGVQELAVID